MREHVGRLASVTEKFSCTNMVPLMLQGKRVVYYSLTIEETCSLKSIKSADEPFDKNASEKSQLNFPTVIEWAETNSGYRRVQPNSKSKTRTCSSS